MAQESNWGALFSVNQWPLYSQLYQFVLAFPIALSLFSVKCAWVQVYTVQSVENENKLYVTTKSLATNIDVSEACYRLIDLL